MSSWLRGGAVRGVVGSVGASSSLLLLLLFSYRVVTYVFAKCGIKGVVVVVVVTFKCFVTGISTTYVWYYSKC